MIGLLVWIFVVAMPIALVLGYLFSKYEDRNVK